jgi:hypothetical protein
VFSTTFYGSDAVLRALRDALEELRKGGAT